MINILFYDSTIDTSCSLLSTKTLTQDYFTKEAKNALPYLGMKYIRSPYAGTLATINRPYTFSCDISNPSLQTIKPDKSPDRPCVIFKTYR